MTVTIGQPAPVKICPRCRAVGEYPGFTTPCPACRAAEEDAA